MLEETSSFSYSTRRFIEEVLPANLEGEGPLQVYISTYNYVSDYPSGPAPCRDPMRQLVVYSGPEQRLSDSIRGLIGFADAPMTELVPLLRAEEARCTISQAVVEDQIRMTAATLLICRLLFICYGGFSAIGRVIEYLKEVRATFPHATVICLTCDCDSQRKLRQLQPKLDTGEINHVIMSPNCGGYYDLRAIADAIAGAEKIRYPRT